MSFLFPGLRRGLMVSAPLILSTPLLMRQYNRPILCDGPDPLTKITSDLRGLTTRSTNTDTPIVKQSGGLNPRAVRNISLGSILGVLGGLGVSVFSKPLALLIGLGVVIVQLLETRGIHIIPYSYLQRRLKRTDIQSMVLANPAFKFSLGITFALAAFAEF